MTSVNRPFSIYGWEGSGVREDVSKPRGTKSAGVSGGGEPIEGGMAGSNRQPYCGPALELQLLGEFRLWQGDSAVELAPRAEHLLAFLALRSNTTRTAVSAELWPDLDDPQARGCLRTTLWRLPKLNGIPLIAATRDRIYLTSFVQVDIVVLQHKLGQWLPGEAPPITINSLSCDLLPAWPDDWLVNDRECQRQFRLHTLERISAWYLSAGRFDCAIEAALQAIAGDPLRESAHRCLIDAHLAEGNMSEARRQAHRYVALLTEAEIPAQLISTRMQELLFTNQSLTAIPETVRSMS